MKKIAAFDIGYKNFSYVIEEVSTDDVPDLQEQLQYLDSLLINPSHTKQQRDAQWHRYNPDGTFNESFALFMDTIFSKGKVLAMKNSCLVDAFHVYEFKPGGVTTKGQIKTKKTKYITQDILKNLSWVIQNERELLDQCDIYIIEEQRKVNTNAIRLAHHVSSILNINCNYTKPVISFPSYHKTKVLGAPRKEMTSLKTGKKKYESMTQTERKKWNTELALRILQMRKDEEWLDLLRSMKKKDDVSDCLCMIQAFKFMYYVNDDIFEY